MVGETLKQAEIIEIYQKILGRSPDPTSLASWTKRAITREALEQKLKDSPEYKYCLNMPVVSRPSTGTGTGTRQNLVNLNTPEKYDELYFGWRTIQLMELMDVANLLKLIVKNGKILDLGCGLGRYFKYFNECDISGIELSLKAIAATMEMYPGAHISQHDLNKGIPFPNEEFDYVYAGELLEHIENPSFIVDEFYRVLKLDGILFANTPFKAEIATEEHLWQFDLNDIKTLFSKFTEKSIFRFCVDPVERWEHFLIVGKKA